MNQRFSYSAVAPAVYKAMLALQASVDKSGLEKRPDGSCVRPHFTSQEDEGAPIKLTRYFTASEKGRMQMNSKRKHGRNRSVQTTQGGER